MDKKEILVNASPGSGNTFCRWLITGNLDATVIWKNHEVGAFREWPNSIFILRDPYDAIPSGIEVDVINLVGEEKEYHKTHKEFRLKHKLTRNLRDYELMLNALDEFPLIKAVTFEFLTDRPEEFLCSMARHFGLKFSNNRISPENLLKQLDNLDNAMGPREKSEERKTIDKMVREDERLPMVYKKYLKLKETIQSTENN